MTASLLCMLSISEIRAQVPSVLNEIAKRFVCCNLYEAIVLQRELFTVCLYILFRRTVVLSFIRSENGWVLVWINCYYYGVGVMYTSIIAKLEFKTLPVRIRCECDIRHNTTARRISWGNCI